MAIETFDLLPEEPKASGNKIETFVLKEDEGAGWADTVAQAAPRAGLALVEGAGGVVQSIGDLLRIGSVADAGASVARAMREEQALRTPEGQTFGQQAVSGGIQSAAQMVPAFIGGPAGLAARGIALATGQQFGESYADLRDKGFSGGSAGLHASIRALAEGVGEKVSLGVLSETSRPFLNKLYEFMRRDLVGEQFTTAVQMLDAKFSDNPNMTLGEYLDAAAMTAAVTPIAAGLQVGAAHTIQAVTGQGTLDQGGGEVPPAEPAPVTPLPEEPVPVTSVVTPGAAPTATAVLPGDADMTKLDGLIIQVPVFVESTGETEMVAQPAAAAWNEAQIESTKYKQLWACVKGAA